MALRRRAGAAVLDTLDPEGRPLFAAYAGDPWPADPYLALWHGATLLREHRGDGHIHELVGAALPGCDAMLLALLWREHIEDAHVIMTRDRGWSSADVDEAYARLQERKLVGADREITSQGRRFRAEIEQRTDRRSLLAGQAPELVDDVTEIFELLQRAALALIPRSNPIGIQGGQD